jgi:glycosyltransferase involved in cell wall biosynthesis
LNFIKNLEIQLANNAGSCKGETVPRKITIITPSLNSLNLLKETAYSILNQKALLVKDVELEYIIQDGGSTDGTSEWIDSLQHPCIRYSSEKDKGMYEALAKGLSITTGDVIGYLNCGDYLSPYAFDIISRVFLDVKIRWFTGYNTWYNHDGYMISANLPFRYRRGLIRKGIYHKFNLFIQQESTFWRQDLMPELDLEKLSAYRLAGDYFIWTSFAKITELHIAKAYVGGFRHHRGQLSEEKEKYKAELDSIVDPQGGLLDYMTGLADLLRWYLPDRIKIALNPNIIRFD